MMFLPLHPLWQRTIAHRGGIWQTPQERNTWQSITLATQEKVIPEIDIVPLKDGTPIVCHNPWLPKYLRGNRPWFFSLVPLMSKKTYEKLCQKAGITPLTLDHVLASVKKSPVLVDVKWLTPNLKTWFKHYTFEPYHRETLRLQSFFSKDIAWLRKQVPVKVWQVIGLDDSGASSALSTRLFTALSHGWAKLQLIGSHRTQADGFNIAGNLIQDNGTPSKTIAPLVQAQHQGKELTFWTVYSPFRQAQLQKLSQTINTVGQVIEGNLVHVLKPFTR
ncbi:MAG: hypothetical protein ACKO37_02280 [Vampirovibrionales bacterium]